MVCLKVVLILLQSLIFASSESLRDKLLGYQGMQITRVDGLCGSNDVPILLYLHGVTANSTVAHCASATIVIKEDNIPVDVQCTVTITRCRSRENLDSCEEFFQDRKRDLCPLINPDNIILSPFIVPFKPKYKCPLKKGIYQAYNFTFNLMPFIVFPVDGWYWKIEVQCFLPKVKRLMGCTYLEGYTVLRSRY